ncbi:MAG: BLUF domain-containing protein [Phenylobacterium sp.]|uniref:BLUF domain-containing protein n=1 Tax=Phenylobacterium sp. TaxID=1871053 RepID=UPI001A5E278E|nr:BLUF domain-containing protein [Phenylobacterium sp.]MBL8772763.1 BLUF domain-containing protein [Phenylobacterium sp.]
MQQISGARTLHRLIYCSRQRIAPHDLDHEVGEIIRASIRKNREVNLTGLLLVHQGYFVQSLEGPAEAVLTTYRRINDDPRHAECKVLSAGPAGAREFGDWNMCARGMSAADDAILRTLGQRETFTPESLSARAALRLLKTVRGIQSRTQLRAML